MGPFLFLLFALGGVHAGAASLEDWQGSYAYHVKTEEEGLLSASLTISECTKEKCRYSYEAGTAQSLCHAEGSFALGDSKNLDHAVALESQKMGCEITLDRAKDQAIRVDSKDLGSTTENADEPAGCNALCGIQGARFFDLTLKKKAKRP